MQRRDFLASSAIGSFALGAGQLALDGIAPDAQLELESPGMAPLVTRKILIAGGGYNEAFQIACWLSVLPPEQTMPSMERRISAQLCGIVRLSMKAG